MQGQSKVNSIKGSLSSVVTDNYVSLYMYEREDI